MSTIVKTALIGAGNVGQNFLRILEKKADVLRDQYDITFDITCVADSSGVAISESGFVFDPVSGHHFTVNETGLEILRYLQKDQDLAELLALLGQEYSVGTRELERDVLEFAGMLRKFVGD